MEAAANLPEGGLTLSHVIELVLIVAITTNYMQYVFGKCGASKASGLYKFLPFHLATLATLFLCFPKADVVVGDLVPSSQSFAYLPGPKQHSAIVGTAFLLLSVGALLCDKKGEKEQPLLASS